MLHFLAALNPVFVHNLPASPTGMCSKPSSFSTARESLCSVQVSGRRYPLQFEDNWHSPIHDCCHLARGRYLGNRGSFPIYEGRSIIYLPKQERRQWADWNKSVRVGTCLEVSHMQPQLIAILSEWQHVKWACVWALSRRVAPSWQCASAHVCKISSCHSAMLVPTAKSPTL